MSESFQTPMRYKMICAQVWNPVRFNKQANSTLHIWLYFGGEKYAYMYLQVM